MQNVPGALKYLPHITNAIETHGRCHATDSKKFINLFSFYISGGKYCEKTVEVYWLH